MEGNNSGCASIRAKAVSRAKISLDDYTGGVKVTGEDFYIFPQTNMPTGVIRFTDMTKVTP
jgi:hypothetical protein